MIEGRVTVERRSLRPKEWLLVVAPVTLHMSRKEKGGRHLYTSTQLLGISDGAKRL